jgi:hypothetical protein
MDTTEMLSHDNLVPTEDSNRILLAYESTAVLLCQPAW